MENNLRKPQREYEAKINMGSPASMATSTSQLWHLRLREHQGRGGRKTERTRAAGSLLWDSLPSDGCMNRNGTTAISTDILPRKGIIHRLPSLDEELQATNACWENYPLPGTSPLIYMVVPSATKTDSAACIYAYLHIYVDICRCEK